MVSARLVSKGYAEVRFLNKKDAKTAIEKYDRRELDGIPMTVRMVEPTAAAANNNTRLVLNANQCVGFDLFLCRWVWCDIQCQIRWYLTESIVNSQPNRANTLGN